MGSGLSVPSQPHFILTGLVPPTLYWSTLKDSSTSFFTSTLDPLILSIPHYIYYMGSDLSVPSQPHCILTGLVLPALYWSTLYYNYSPPPSTPLLFIIPYSTLFLSHSAPYVTDKATVDACNLDWASSERGFFPFYVSKPPGWGALVSVAMWRHVLQSSSKGGLFKIYYTYQNYQIFYSIKTTCHLMAFTLFSAFSRAAL